ncbi:hypothetical protein CSUI_003551 [Cystoisospora suis]|uniref:Uncharacterized protein n=1 Tax=Cystoisospora suis TaxID=483139 RepID=A0A2C6KQ28_9APIC|nr:hypothetical protein CSUI_003551 [Cystoisospora suis]
MFVEKPHGSPSRHSIGVVSTGFRLNVGLDWAFLRFAVSVLTHRKKGVRRGRQRAPLGRLLCLDRYLRLSILFKRWQTINEVLRQRARLKAMDRAHLRESSLQLWRYSRPLKSSFSPCSRWRTGPNRCTENLLQKGKKYICRDRSVENGGSPRNLYRSRIFAISSRTFSSSLAPPLPPFNSVDASGCCCSSHPGSATAHFHYGDHILYHPPSRFFFSTSGYAFSHLHVPRVCNPPSSAPQSLPSSGPSCSLSPAASVERSCAARSAALRFCSPTRESTATLCSHREVSRSLSSCHRLCCTVPIWLPPKKVSQFRVFQRGFRPFSFLSHFPSSVASARLEKRKSHFSFDRTVISKANLHTCLSLSPTSSSFFFFDSFSSSARSLSTLSRAYEPPASLCGSEPRPLRAVSSLASAVSRLFRRFTRWVTGACVLFLPVGLWCSVFTPVLLVCPDAPLSVDLSFVSPNSIHLDDGDGETDTSCCCSVWPEAHRAKERGEASEETPEGASTSSRIVSDATGMTPQQGEDKKTRQVETARKKCGAREQQLGEEDALEDAGPADSGRGSNTDVKEPDADERSGHEASDVARSVERKDEEEAESEVALQDQRTGIVCVGTPFLLREGLWRNTVVYVQHPMRSPEKIFLRLVAGEGNIIRFPARALLSIHPTLRKELLVSGQGRVVGPRGERDQFLACYVMRELLRQCDEEIAAEMICRANGQTPIQPYPYSKPQWQAEDESSEKNSGENAERRKASGLMEEDYDGPGCWIMTAGKPLFPTVIEAEDGAGEVAGVLSSPPTKTHISRNIPISTPEDNEGASCVSVDSSNHLASEKGSHTRESEHTTRFLMKETTPGGTHEAAVETNAPSSPEVTPPPSVEESSGCRGKKVRLEENEKHVRSPGAYGDAGEAVKVKEVEEVLYIELTVPKGRCWLEAERNICRNCALERNGRLLHGKKDDREQQCGHAELRNASFVGRVCTEPQRGRCLMKPGDGVWPAVSSKEIEDSFTFGFVPAGLIAGAAFWVLPTEHSVNSARLMVSRACVASVVTELMASFQSFLDRRRRFVRKFLPLEWRQGKSSREGDVSASGTKEFCEKRPHGDGEGPERGDRLSQIQRGGGTVENIRGGNLQSSPRPSYQESERRTSPDDPPGMPGTPGLSFPQRLGHGHDEPFALHEDQRQETSFWERVFFNVEQWLVKHADLRVVAADDSRLVSAKGTVVVG